MIYPASGKLDPTLQVRSWTVAAKMSLTRTLQQLQSMPPDGPALVAAIVDEELDFKQLQELTLSLLAARKL